MGRGRDGAAAEAANRRALSGKLKPYTSQWKPSESYQGASPSFISDCCIGRGDRPGEVGLRSSMHAMLRRAPNERTPEHYHWCKFRDGGWLRCVCVSRDGAGKGW